MRARNAFLVALVAAGTTVLLTGRAPGAQPASPHIYGIFPNTGSAGETVVVFGQGFDHDTANDKLTFNAVASTVSFSTHHIMFAQVPTVPLGVVNVSVVVSGNTSNIVTFTVIAPTPPVIAALSSTTGPPGSPLLITGTGLGNVFNTFWPHRGFGGNPDSFVSFGATDSRFAFFANTRVFTLVPFQLQPGAVQVGVTVNGLASNTLPFTVDAAQPGQFGGFGGGGFGGGPGGQPGGGPGGQPGGGGFGGGFFGGGFGSP